MNKKQNAVGTRVRFPLVGILCLLCATVLAAALPTEAEAKIYEDTVRLHVLANSDSEEDQQMKLRVRDFLLARYAPQLRSDSPVKAKETAARLAAQMEAAVCNLLAEAGTGYGACISVGEESYPTREYDGRVVPAGRYVSVRVVLGTGEGHNWWCVMYPPLCLSAALGEPSEESGYTEAEERLTRGKMRVRFKLLEFAAALFPET